MTDSKPRLMYFAGRGLAEMIRLALSAAHIEFEDVCLHTRDEFLQLIKEGKLLFQQVPVLEIDGQSLAGSGPSVRYVCRKGKLEGKTEADQTKIDTLSMGARDMLDTGLSFAAYKTTPEEQVDLLRDAAEKSTQRYLPVYEIVLSENNSRFLVGDSITMADILFFDSIAYFNDVPEIKSKLKDFPKCTAFIALLPAAGDQGVPSQSQTSATTPGQ